ncbi:BamA/TamA family outer membrane protein [Fulvivirgaceae bacterium BMA10]|uniref:BamA/TamA family outer membrane protein n=1 Tax=Splendidivirga corallicola TaxID=3051826 RepID=A0ABT8KT15_9BACT|nr:BamA/TamA family outer membrane protein [Fulvivirgaceae bacterium BMA10]
MLKTDVLKKTLAAFCTFSFLFIIQPYAFGSTVQSDSLLHTIYLIGDAGEPAPGIHLDQNLLLLENQLMASGEKSTVIFLGDNIYPMGLPEKNHHSRKSAERKINEQIEIVKKYEGQIAFIPGNHDWKKGKRKGHAYILNQEEYVENALDSANVFLPDGGCPGPVEIHPNEEMVIIILDTQWFLHPWEKPEEESDCDAKSSVEVFVKLEDVLRRNSHKKIVIAAHHPMYTYGIHGGKSTFKQHLFPLTDMSDGLYIPLPVIGSIYPLYRKYIGNIQDATNARYKVMRRAMISLFEQYPNLIYASGHEHSLQYITNNKVHYVVSGSGSKTTPVKQGKYAKFVQSKKGFARINYYTNGDVKLEMWSPTADKKGVKIYETTLFNQKYDPTQAYDFVPDGIDFSDSTVTMAASQRYKATKGKQTWLGENYRKEWSQEIQIPVFDIGKEKGGLKILQRGGGMQTKSLRLENPEGRQYVLRSIEKYPEKAIPAILRGSFAAEIVEDQISSSHPYGFYVIPQLADAAGIYHTNPKYVYLPDDPRFGVYRPDFANTLALFEERPSGDQGDADFFGNSKKIYSTPKMLEKLYKDNDNRVDQKFVLRNRLFDLVIGDWDRHDDQWRWASFEKGKGLEFRPIPRDRDQAFFRGDGIVPSIASRKWALPKTEGFNPEVRYVEGFMNNGRFFDRSFLNELSAKDWRKMADNLKEKLTDEVIEKAVKTWPTEIYQLSGERIISTLKARRNIIGNEAQKYYAFLAKAVDVFGSNKTELFKVERVDDNKTKVTVRKISKDGDVKRKMYERTFKTDETKEIRLYGLNGDDQFQISGDVKKGIKVRVIGGEGDDLIEDNSKVSNGGKKTWIYDTKTGNTIKFGSESKDKTSDDPGVNEYNRKAFKYNVTIPLIYANINADDGLWLGGGFLATKHGFRKDPFKSKHFVLGSYAFNTSSFNLKYKGDFAKVLGNWDVQFNADLQGPDFAHNYFGLGNESAFDKDTYGIEYYRVRYENFLFNVLLRKRLGEKKVFSFGPTYQSIEVEQTENRFISDTNNPANDVSPNVFETKEFAGLRFGLEIDSRDSKALTKRGVYLNIGGEIFAAANKNTDDLTRLTGELALYHTFKVPGNITFATRVGGSKLFGDFEFYQAAILSGTQNLRGYRKTRFAGESSFYSNTDIRIKLFGFRSYLFPGYFGIQGFYDVGRVWLDGENSSEWHSTYGGGIWVAPFRTAVVSLSLGKSEEETLPLIGLGFFF